MIRFAAIGLIGLLAILAYWFSDTARARTVSGIFDRFVNGSPSIDQDAFENETIAAVNLRRRELGLPSLREDREIHDALARFAVTERQLADVRLEPLFEILKRQIPSAQFLSATIQLNPSEDGLQKSLANWEDASSPEYDTISTLAFRDGLRKGCIGVLARKLPHFDLEAANQIGGRFFHRCPHCECAHSVTLDQQSRTLILACPECELPYDLVAADTSGKFERAHRFLEGFQLPPPPDSPPGRRKDPEEALIEIWNRVLKHCEYENDSEAHQVSEAWKRPRETWRDQRGDCEDTSILLADALISEGIEARVCVGWNIHIGQHAWCVARVGDEQWILESTLRLQDDQLPELRSTREGGEEYQPEQLFDRNQLYFRADNAEPSACLDYWSTEIWQSLSPG